MANSAEIHTQILQALLPQGRIWPRDAEATLSKLLATWALELARVDARADDLMDEVDPSTTLELLSDFERVCGLPDKCSFGDETLEQRRGEVLAKLTSRGGQTPAYFIGLAAQLGYTVEIEEFRPFRAGSRAGERAYATDLGPCLAGECAPGEFQFFHGRELCRGAAFHLGQRPAGVLRGRQIARAHGAFVCLLRLFGHRGRRNPNHGRR